MKDGTCLTCKFAFFATDGIGSCNWKPKGKNISTAHAEVHPIIDKRFPYRRCPAYKYQAKEPNHG